MKFIKLNYESCLNIHRMRALCWYFASLMVLSFGTILAAWHYPGGYDWLYTVASALASQKDNPEGSIWFSSALSLAMVLLWPYASALKKGLSPSLSKSTEYLIAALRIGLVCGALLGLERLLIHELSDLIYKGHEIIALFAFLGLYAGILGLLVQAMLRQRIYVLPVLLIVTPMIAIGITQFWLYINQRDLGWVDTSWREMGIPLWLSFAFWQWFAIGFLWVGMGLLSFTCIGENKPRAPNSPS